MSIQQENVSVADFTFIEAPSILGDLPVPRSVPGSVPRASGSGPRLELAECWPFSALQVAWRGLPAADLAAALGVPALPQSMADAVQRASDGARLLPLMPGRALRLAAQGLPAQRLSQLQDAGAYTLELCEGRGLLTLKGAAWRWTLMKGGSLDFEALAPGQVAQTSLFKISTLIWVVAVDEVHLLVPLSFARALSERLLDAGVDQVSKTLQLFD